MAIVFIRDFCERTEISVFFAEGPDAIMDATHPDQSGYQSGRIG